MHVNLFYDGLSIDKLLTLKNRPPCIVALSEYTSEYLNHLTVSYNILCFSSYVVLTCRHPRLLFRHASDRTRRLRPARAEFPAARHTERAQLLVENGFERNGRQRTFPVGSTESSRDFRVFVFVHVAELCFCHGTASWCGLRSRLL